MSDTTGLRLVDPREHEFDSIPMEKRSSPRWRLSGRVTALISEQLADERRNRISSVELLNMSQGGIGAFSLETIPADAMITIFIPPHGPEAGYDVTGQVVRLRPRDGGYEFGIRVFRRMAAA